MFLMFLRSESVELGIIGDFGVAPELFEFVALTGFGQKNVHPYVAVVHNDPFGILSSVGVKRFEVGVFEQTVAQMV